MADKKVSQLPALTGAATVASDLLYIVDVSEPLPADQSKSITVAQFQAAPFSGGTANGVVYLNGSKSATSGTGLTFDGTTLTNAGQTVFKNDGLISDGTNTVGRFYGLAAGVVWRGESGLYQRWDLGSSEQMRLTSTGLGIGTSSPAVKLHVVGSIRYTSDLEIADSGGTVRGYIFGNSSGNTYRTNSGLSHFWQNSGTTQLTLDSSGNLGLGVTPSAWGSSYGTKAIQVGPVGSLSSLQASTTNNQTYVSSNAYFGASNWTYLYSDYATQYRQYAGQHNWFTAASGTAGNAISFTQAMTLDASGNLVIGDTSGTARLEVKATGVMGRFKTGAASDGRVEWAYNTTDIGYIGADSSTEFSVIARSGNVLKLGAGGSERARITSGGYFKASNAGTYNGSSNSYHENYNSASDEWITWFQSAPATNPKGLRVYYSAAAPNGTGNHFLYCDDTGGQRASIRSNGGLANYQANDVNLSDARLKTDVVPVASYWDKIKSLEIVSFKYKDQTDDVANIGVIAQQVESVAPEFVSNDGFGEAPEGEAPYKTIYTTDMYHAAIKALQEAMSRIETLEAEVAALKGN